YYLFSEKVKRMDPNDIQMPEMPEGTEIFSSINQLLEQTDPFDEVRVLLFSDGQDELDIAELDALKLWQVPVFTVGLGEYADDDALSYKDISVNKIILSDVVLLMNPVRVSARIRALGGGSDHVPVTLKMNGEMVSKKDLALRKGQRDYEVEFEWLPSSEGKAEMSVEAGTLDGEKETRNNVLVKKTEVLASSNRILFLQGKWSWEYAWLRKSLKNLKSLEVHSMVFAGKNKILSDHPGLEKGFPSRENLFHYGSCVLADCPSDWLTGENWVSLEKFVSEKGGGLVILAGEALLGRDKELNPSLVKLLPVVMDRQGSFFYDKTPREIFLDTRAEGSWFNPDTPKLGETNPGISGCFYGCQLKSSAFLLLQDKNTQGGLSVVPAAYQRFGSGRVVYVGFDTSWKWFFNSTRQDWKAFYSWFWKSVFSFAMGQKKHQAPDEALFYLQMEDETAMEGKEVRINFFLGEGCRTDAEKKLSVQVTDPDKKMFTLPFEVPYGEPGFGHASFVPEMSGDYRVEGILEREKAPLKDQIVVSVRKDMREYEDLTLNESSLKRISDETGGEYLPLSAYLKKPFVFEREPVSQEKVMLKPFWNSSWVFVIFIGVMAFGWILRRSINLD
ncbi:MAG: VWA domain-containing protein, partial [Candidatus Aureabacteria bacterium]|nr:VWA domain-containing protein [Candidatus Auribacterota bacterium]